MTPCVFCVVCCAFVRCALRVLLLCNVWVLACVGGVCVWVSVLVCHADPTTTTHTSPPLSPTREGLGLGLQPGRSDDGKPQAKKKLWSCSHTHGGRFERTHGGFQRATPHRTHTERPQGHTHKTQHPPSQQHTETGTERDRERDTEKETRQDKTRRQEKMKEERQDKTREEKRREKMKDKRREERRQEERR